MSIIQQSPTPKIGPVREWPVNSGSGSGEDLHSIGPKPVRAEPGTITVDSGTLETTLSFALRCSLRESDAATFGLDGLDLLNAGHEQ